MLNYLKTTMSDKLQDSFDTYGFSSVQQYVPIYNEFFELTVANYNSIKLNHPWHITEIQEPCEDYSNTFRVMIRHKDTGKQKITQAFIKSAPLLDPIKLLTGGFKHQMNDICVLPQLTHDTRVLKKASNAYNASYVDGLFNFVNGALLPLGFIHGVEFYGSYIANKQKYTFDISDDLDYLRYSTYFKKHNGTLFDVSTEAINDPIDIIADITPTTVADLTDIVDLTEVDICVGDNTEGHSPYSVEDLLEYAPESMEYTECYLEHLPKTESYSSENTGVCVDTIDANDSIDSSEDNMEYDLDDEDDDEDYHKTLIGHDDIILMDEFDVTESFTSLPKCCPERGDPVMKEYCLPSLSTEHSPKEDTSIPIPMEEDATDAKESDEDFSTIDTECDGDDDEDSDYDDEIMATLLVPFPVHLICIEKCEDTLDSLLIDNELTDDELFACMAQIVMILLTYQKAFDFTHNDLHTNNIVYVETRKKYIEYIYNGDRYCVPTYGRIFKIIDFGRSIFTLQGQLVCGDSYNKHEHAYSQYNFGPCYNPKHPVVEPNYSFDLCRLACSMVDFFIPEYNGPQKVSPFGKFILHLCMDDTGYHVLYKANNQERYPDFRLYKMIARTVHQHTPENILTRDEFQAYKQPNGLSKNSGSTIVNIDQILTSVKNLENL